MKKIYTLLIFIMLSSHTFAQKQHEKENKIMETYEESEVRLKEVYQSVSNIVDKENKKLLVESQRDWLKFRESECKFEAIEATSETEKAQIGKDCLFELNKRRIQDLMTSYIVIRLKQNPEQHNTLKPN
ncbi:MAG TPA: lysozyme inhibitor LprI family protein [Flavobacterium sp.]|nr:lysozyme inhibitor LprI family protein [Flavobacterium sp.]